MGGVLKLLEGSCDVVVAWSHNSPALAVITTRSPLLAKVHFLPPEIGSAQTILAPSRMEYLSGAPKS